jgi:hypothetical protein
MVPRLERSSSTVLGLSHMATSRMHISYCGLVSGRDVRHKMHKGLPKHSTKTLFAFQTEIVKHSTALLSESVFKAGFYHTVTRNAPGLLLKSKD